MMDEREDRLDALLRDAAQEYNAPPAPPRAEMWEKITAARRADGRAGGRADGRKGGRDGLWFRRPVQVALAIAALLALGVAIGRLTVPGNPVSPAAAPAAGEIAAVPTGNDSSAPSTPRPGSPSTERQERGQVAARLATQQYLGQVESFLTEFDTRNAAEEFPTQARGLLSTTRLLLDSKRLTDVPTRKLLEDLELILAQIATLGGNERREDVESITDGLTQNNLRTRIRNAIPTGPTIRM